MSVTPRDDGPSGARLPVGVRRRSTRAEVAPNDLLIDTLYVVVICGLALLSSRRNLPWPRRIFARPLATSSTVFEAVLRVAPRLRSRLA
jgi:hypothetical protein